MDYLAQAKTFLHRAKDTNDAQERMTHLDMAAEMLAKAIEELGQSCSMSGVSGLSWQEADVFGPPSGSWFQARPGCPGSVSFAGVGHARFGR